MRGSSFGRHVEEKYSSQQLGSRRKRNDCMDDGVMAVNLASRYPALEKLRFATTARMQGNFIEEMKKYG